MVQPVQRNVKHGKKKLEDYQMFIFVEMEESEALLEALVAFTDLSGWV